MLEIARDYPYLFSRMVKYGYISPEEEAEILEKLTEEEKIVAEYNKSQADLKTLQQLEDFKREILGRPREKLAFSIKEPLVGISYEELLKMDIPPLRWIIDRIIPYAGVTALSAPPGHYKTWFALYLAIHIAQGKPLWEKYNTEKTGVLFVNEENYIGLLRDRITMMTREETMPLYIFDNLNIKLDEERCREILDFCKSKGLGFIIFDSLTRIHLFQENVSSEMSRLYDYLKIFTKEGISVLYTHHHRKRNPNEWKPISLESMRGSSELGAQIDTNLSIEAIKDGLILHQLKQRSNLLLDPIYIKVVERDGLFDFEMSNLLKIEEMKDNENLERILKLIENNPGITQKELKDRAKLDAQSSLSRYLNKLEEVGKVYFEGERPKRYFKRIEENEMF